MQPLKQIYKQKTNLKQTNLQTNKHIDKQTEQAVYQIKEINNQRKVEYTTLLLKSFFVDLNH